MDDELDNVLSRVATLSKDLKEAVELLQRGNILMKAAAMEIATLTAERDLLHRQRDRLQEEVCVLNRALIRERELRSEPTLH